MTRKYLPAVRSACGITFAVLITSAGAQLPTARLDSIFPPGLRGGTECEVTIGGADLDDADRLLFSDAGLSATRVEGLKFKVTASAGMAPGLYEVRAAGRYGISASRLFAVGTIPEVNEPADNASPEKSFNVTPPVTINGTAGPEAGDHFRFKAVKDQRVLISCAAERIDSALNAVVTLSDAAGRELASAHRTQSGDASMDFTAPADGDYIVEVHDMAWQQGTYRLSIAPPEAAGSPAGPAMPLSGAVCDWMPASPPQEIKAPAPAASAAHKITLPGIVSGTGSQEWLEFTGEKNRRVMLDLLSHRLGQPSDWLLRVLKITRDDKGQEKSEQLAQFDDTPAPAGAEQLRPDPPARAAWGAAPAVRFAVRS